jgi:hypothetical protein
MPQNAPVPHNRGVNPLNQLKYHPGKTLESTVKIRNGSTHSGRADSS